MKLTELQIESLMWWEEETKERTLPEAYFTCLFFSNFITCKGLDCVLTQEGSRALDLVGTLDWEELLEL